jgi:aspartyl/asparaginyl beta-hydroxylase (cupin superfamily)
MTFNLTKFVDENSKLCPETTNLLQNLPNIMKNTLSYVYFSVIAPGTHSIN